MRGHGVPHAALLQLGQSHLQLTGSLFQRGVYNQLVDGTLVALSPCSQGFLLSTHDGGLQRLYLTVLTSVQRHPLGLVVLVGSSGVQVELGRLLGILRTEDDLLVRVDVLAVLVLAQPSTTDIQRLAVSQGVLLSVYDDNTVSTRIDDTQLTVTHEVVGTQLRMRLQLQVLVHRHSTAKDEAVVHRIRQVNLVSLHHLLHYKTVTQCLCVIVLHVSRMTGRLEAHGLLCRH